MSVKNLLLTALVFAAVASSSAIERADAAKIRSKGRSSSKSNSKSADKKKKLNLPNKEDPEVAKALKCNSCIAVAYEIHNSLTTIDKFRHNVASRYELFEILEGVCPRMRHDYGLFYTKQTAVDGSPLDSTIEFRSKSRAPEPDAIQQGGWVGNMIEERCAHFVDKYEKGMLDEFKNLLVDEFVRMVCIQWDKSCEAAPKKEEDEKKSAEEAEEEYADPAEEPDVEEEGVAARPASKSF